MTATLTTRPLGARSGLTIPDLGLGLWAVDGGEWGAGDDAASRDAIRTAFDGGVRFFDTADKYSDGHSEQLLGEVLADVRDEVVIATKIGWNGYDHERGVSAYDTPESIVAGVESSLRRLGVDHVDVIQCHIDVPDPHTDNYLEGFRRLKADGKVRAWGVSTSDVERLRYFDADGDCDVLQVDYSLLNRTMEAEMLPYCQDAGIGVIIRGPLAMGLLTGRYDAGASFPDGDFRQAWTTDPAQREQFLADLAVVDRLRDVVPEDQPMAAFALRFVRSHPAVSVVIPGARTPRQAAANTAAGLLPPLDDAEQAAVDAIVEPGGGRRIWPA